MLWSPRSLATVTLSAPVLSLAESRLLAESSSAEEKPNRWSLLHLLRTATPPVVKPPRPTPIHLQRRQLSSVMEPPLRRTSSHRRRPTPPTLNTEPPPAGPPSSKPRPRRPTLTPPRRCRLVSHSLRARLLCLSACLCSSIRCYALDRGGVFDPVQPWSRSLDRHSNRSRYRRRRNWSRTYLGTQGRQERDHHRRQHLHWWSTVRCFRDPLLRDLVCWRSPDFAVVLHYSIWCKHSGVCPVVRAENIVVVHLSNHSR